MPGVYQVGQRGGRRARVIRRPFRSLEPEHAHHPAGLFQPAGGFQPEPVVRPWPFHPYDSVPEPQRARPPLGAQCPVHDMDQPLTVRELSANVLRQITRVPPRFGAVGGPGSEVFYLYQPQLLARRQTEKIHALQPLSADAAKSGRSVEFPYDPVVRKRYFQITLAEGIHSVNVPPAY